MNVDCPTCKVLWDEFSEATRAHVTILGKSQLAQIEQNSAVLTQLEPLKRAAAERGGKARLAFKDHEASHQNGKAMGQSA